MVLVGKTDLHLIDSQTRFYFDLKPTMNAGERFFLDRVRDDYSRTPAGASRDILSLIWCVSAPVFAMITVYVMRPRLIVPCISLEGREITSWSCLTVSTSSGPPIIRKALFNFGDLICMG